MSMIQSDLLLGQEGGGYEILRSLRFNSSDSGFCSRTFTSAGNRKTWTWAGWVKRTNLSTASRIWSGGSTTSDTGYFSVDFFNSAIAIAGYNTNFRITTAVYRDPSAWMHIVVAVDTNQSTPNNRIRLYVNGSEVTTFSTNNTFTQGNDTGVNQTQLHLIGGNPFSSANMPDMYLADVHFIDGQQLTPSSFTEVDATTGQLKPKAYSGSFGTNGFWLKFSDNSAATATTLGKDYSGNFNNWTPNNLSITGQSGIGYPQALSAGSGSVTDSTLAFDGNTGTFAYAGSSATITFTPPSPISFSTKLEFWAANGNGPGSNDQRYSFNGGSEVSCAGGEWTTVVNGSGTLTSLAVRNTLASISRLSAVRVDGTILLYNNGSGNDSLVDTPTSYGTDTGAGNEVRGNYCTWNPLDNGSVTLSNGNLDGSATVAWKNVRGTIAFPSSGKWYYEVTPGGSALLGVGIAAANKNLTDQSTGTFVTYNEDGRFYKDGSINATGKATYTSGDVIGVAFDCDTNSVTFYKNNVSQGSVTPTTGVSYFPFVQIYNSSLSANWGSRPFAYTAPSGFKALVDTNIPVVIAKPSTVMDVKLYTGNGSTQTISGLGFSPDLVWIKERSAAINHLLFDQVRGVRTYLISNATNAEATAPTHTVTAFNSDGFSVSDTSDGAWGSNGLNKTYVGWLWDAGANTVSNTAGSITSQVRANASAGFSIITAVQPVTANLGCTVGHGLGVAPAMYIVKDRDLSINWGVYHAGLSSPATQALQLSTTSAAFTATNYWKSTSPTSTVLSIGTSIVGEGNDFVVYAFAPVAGYSAMGSYVASSDLPFVHLGFRPRFLLIKSTSAGTNWVIFDSAIGSYNIVNTGLRPNSSAAEYTDTTPRGIDFLSNGFKVRGDWNSGDTNYGSYTYIYFAVAESPFQYARAR